MATEARAATVALQGWLGSSSVSQDVPEEADPEDLLGRLGPGMKAALLFVALGPPLFICAKNPDSFFPMLEVRFDHVKLLTGGAAVLSRGYDLEFWGQAGPLPFFNCA